MRSPVLNGNFSHKKDYKKLYQVQDKILKIIFQKELDHNFYLTGGTALNRFYYPVRHSEDLDFFTNETHLFRDDLKILLELFKKNELSFSIEINSRDFVRIIFFFEGETVKADFVNDRVYRFGKSKYFQGIRVDNIINILTNKICAIISRDDAKDVADLLTISINEDFVWNEVISIAQKKEVFEKMFFIERLKSFPLEFFDLCSFVAKDIKDFYCQIYSRLIENILRGGENSLKEFKQIFWEKFLGCK